MKRTPSGCSRWIWTELLAFDVTRADFGVSEYLCSMGFVPDGVSLLLSAPDFILQHEGLEKDAPLPPDVCSRNGQEGNEQRARQIWSRHQLRSLVALLREAGCAVYFSVFTTYLENRFHHEWLTDHPEAKSVSAPQGRRAALFVLARLSDGTMLQDFFARQIVRACLDYGFDGWHGADGYGPQWGVFIFGCSDDFVQQFTERGAELPDFVTAPCEESPEALTQRMEWIWRHRRLEWIEFYTDRWAEFWQTVVDALHAVGRRAMINSAWTKDPFEAIYRYGVDYRKIAATGVDAMMVETCAGGILLGSDDRDYHHDYLAMLMLIRACVPDLELVFLHNVKDVAEDWDLLRHAPSMLEREAYSIANVFHYQQDGQIRRCVDGLVACLADGITSEEWVWLSQRWELAFESIPRQISGVTLLWCDNMLDQALPTFPMDRCATVHYLAFRLMEHAAPIQAVARLEHIQSLGDQPLLVLNPHHLSSKEKEAVLAAKGGVAILGPDFSEWPKGSFDYRLEGGNLALRLYNLTFSEPLPIHETEASQVPEDPLSIKEPSRFREELLFQPIPSAFMKTCAEVLRNIGGVGVLSTRLPDNLATPPPFLISTMSQTQPDGTLRVAIKNRALVYGRPTLDLGRPIASATVRSLFPVSRVKPTGSSFAVVVPPRGMVAVDVEFESHPDENKNEAIS